MAILLGDHCPICGVYVKPENLMKHIRRVHPRYSSGMKKLSIDPRKCPICGRINDQTKNRYGLSICNEHYVSDARGYLIKNFYLKLKEENNSELASDPVSFCWLIKYQLHAINDLLGWEPEKINEGQYLTFSETCIFTGYLLLRLIESISEAGEKMYQLVEKDISQITNVIKKKTGKVSILMNAEFELFIGIKMAANKLYDIAVDDESNPELILVVPNIREEAAKNILLLRLKDANEQWHSTFYKFLVPYGRSTASDEFGTSFSFDRSQIKDNFDTFKEVWNEFFQTDTKMTLDDWEKLWDWLKWVITQDGITESDQSRATYFEDYKEFGLKTELVFQILKDVLPNLNEKLELISGKSLSRFDPNLTTLFMLADIARGFKIYTSKGYLYYFPCREWFYNKVMPVFIRLARKLELAGPSFEQDIEILSKVYSHSGIKLGGKSTLGAMIEPRTEEKPMGITSRSIPWRILNRNFTFDLPKNDISEKLGESGEIDLIMYANMNLWLLELKARNLESNRVVKYLREEAPTQCAKYAAWVRSPDFESFLKMHKIEDHKLNSVRIVICSSGVFRDLLVKCEITNEIFSIVSEYTLFSTMAGIFALSLKNPFPSRIENMTSGIKIVNSNIRQINKVDIEYNLGVKISDILIPWVEHIKFDRRQIYEEIQIDVDFSKGVNIFGSTYINYEAHIGDTSSWILPEPYLIDSNTDYSFFIGTQIGNMGETIFCSTCKSSIKYYWPQTYNEDAKKIENILQSSICPICNNKIVETKEIERIRTEMTRIMAKFKYEIGKDFL